MKKRSYQKHEPDFEVVDIDSIRADSLSFEQLIIRSLDRIHQQIFKVSEANEPSSWQALEYSIRGFHAMLAPYYTEEYIEIVEQIESELKPDDLANLDKNYLKMLMYWLNLIIAYFCLPEVGILPPVEKDHYIAKVKDDIYDRAGKLIDKK